MPRIYERRSHEAHKYMYILAIEIYEGIPESRRFDRNLYYLLRSLLRTICPNFGRRSNNNNNDNNNISKSTEVFYTVDIILGTGKNDK